MRFSGSFISMLILTCCTASSIKCCVLHPISRFVLGLPKMFRLSSLISNTAKSRTHVWVINKRRFYSFVRSSFSSWEWYWCLLLCYFIQEPTHIFRVLARNVQSRMMILRLSFVFPRSQAAFPSHILAAVSNHDELPTATIYQIIAFDATIE